MPSPLLYSLYTHDCIPTHSANTIVTFADDTTVLGLILNRDESAYREEVCELSKRSTINNLALNTSKTKELIIYFWKQKEEPVTLHIGGEMVERAATFKFIGASHGLKTQHLW